MDRRKFIKGAAAGAAALSFSSRGWAAQNGPDMTRMRAEIAKRHDESVKRLQDWIHQPSIAAENRGMNEGCDMMMQLLKDAGFGTVTKVPTEGQPGVFATLDAGAPRTVGMYFMYDVKQVDPSEWSSPPWDGKIVDKPGLGKVMVGRGAVNQKGPQASFLAALHAIRGAGQKMPVNLVLVAEGEEEIASPHFPQVVHKAEVEAALAKCTTGVWMPFASQDLDGLVTINLGAKGVVECELVSSGEKWGRGPKKDIHSSLKAMVDSPAWHLVKALDTLVTADGNDPAIPGYMDNVQALSDRDKQLIAEASRRRSEEKMKKVLGVEHWVHDLDFLKAQERLVGVPTINIEGLVGGYTGPGGKTILPHRAVAKLDLRLVPNMTAKDALEKVRAHLKEKGFGDIEVNMSGGYDPTTTSPDSALIRAQQFVYQQNKIDPILWPRLGGSWPGYVFTSAPLSLPAGHFGLGYGTGAHAPDEFYLIESSNPKIEGIDGATRSYVEYLYALADVKAAA